MASGTQPHNLSSAYRQITSSSQFTSTFDEFVIINLESRQNVTTLATRFVTEMHTFYHDALLDCLAYILDGKGRHRGACESPQLHFDEILALGLALCAYFVVTALPSSNCTPLGQG